MTAAMKSELPELHPDVEEQQRDRDRVIRQADLAQRAGEAEPVQQAEREGDEPGEAGGEAVLRPARRFHDLDRDEQRC